MKSWFISHFLIVLATRHSKTRPRSSFNKWTSSIIINFKVWKIVSFFLVKRSHFSGIAINNWVSSIWSLLKLTSPENSEIFKFKNEREVLNFSTISLASAFGSVVIFYPKTFNIIVIRAKSPYYLTRVKNTFSRSDSIMGKALTIASRPIFSSTCYPESNFS